MGCGSSKKQLANVQKQEPNVPYKVEEKRTNQSPPQSPQLPPVPSRRSSGRNETHSVHSRVSNKRSITNQPNGIERRAPSREFVNDTPPESDDDELLPPIENLVKKRNSRSSVQAASVTRSPPINQPRQDVYSLSGFSKCSHRKISVTLNGPIGRCPHCRHCQQTSDASRVSTPKPPWLTENPGIGDIHIDMDKYDIEAVKKKVISENGHLPGSYDYKPYLTIEHADNYDPAKENYYTQPIVAKTKPSILPACTPFPEYDLLQRREQRLNKPYTLPLFD